MQQRWFYLAHHPLQVFSIDQCRCSHTSPCSSAATFERRKTMTRLGVHLLEHAVGAGWCAVSTRIMHELMEVQGLCMDTIFRLACSQGLPLLHR